MVQTQPLKQSQSTYLVSWGKHAPRPTSLCKLLQADLTIAAACCAGAMNTIWLAQGYVDSFLWVAAALISVANSWWAFLCDVFASMMLVVYLRLLNCILIQTTDISVSTMNISVAFSHLITT